MMMMMMMMSLNGGISSNHLSIMLFSNYKSNIEPIILSAHSIRRGERQLDYVVAYCCGCGCLRQMDRATSIDR
jgi:hypothetical protein